MDKFEDNFVIEAPYQKDKSRVTRRKNTYKKINQRKTLIRDVAKKDVANDSYLNNSSEVAKYITGGKSNKTNTRKGHSSYRCKQGTYGEAKKYSLRDKNSLEYIKSQLVDELCEYVDEALTNIQNRDTQMYKYVVEYSYYDTYVGDYTTDFHIYHAHNLEHVESMFYQDFQDDYSLENIYIEV